MISHFKGMGYACARSRYTNRGHQIDFIDEFFGERVSASEQAELAAAAMAGQTDAAGPKTEKKNPEAGKGKAGGNNNGGSKPSAAPPPAAGNGNTDGKQGFSNGAGLRQTAQGAAEQANQAVQNQNAAALQASYVAKNTLAQSAAQSSATAQAALAGKQILLQGTEQQVRDARVALDGEVSIF